jgi:hypothetical protein
VRICVGTIVCERWSVPAGARRLSDAFLRLRWCAPTFFGAADGDGGSAGMRLIPAAAAFSASTASVTAAACAGVKTGATRGALKRLPLLGVSMPVPDPAPVRAVSSRRPSANRVFTSTCITRSSPLATWYPDRPFRAALPDTFCSCVMRSSAFHALSVSDCGSVYLPWGRQRGETGGMRG